jgi:flagellin
MGLTVRTNLTAISAYNSLNATQSSLSSTLGRISSGLRVTKATDDAAGLGVATKLASRLNSLD